MKNKLDVNQVLYKMLLAFDEKDFLSAFTPENKNRIYEKLNVPKNVSKDDLAKVFKTIKKVVSSIPKDNWPAIHDFLQTGKLPDVVRLNSSEMAVLNGGMTAPSWWLQLVKGTGELIAVGKKGVIFVEELSADTAKEVFVTGKGVFGALLEDI